MRQAGGEKLEDTQIKKIATEEQVSKEFFKRTWRRRDSWHWGRCDLYFDKQPTCMG